VLLVWNPRLTSTAGQVVDDGSQNRLKENREERVPVRLELSTKVRQRCEVKCLSMFAVLAACTGVGVKPSQQSVCVPVRVLLHLKRLVDLFACAAGAVQSYVAVCVAGGSGRCLAWLN
jgi:hypothetical protein